MEYHEIRELLHLPAIRLLASPHAAMVLGFLHRVFKRSLRTAVPEGELRSLLEVWLSTLRHGEPEAYPDSPANYLSAWRDAEHGFLRRSFSEDEAEPVYELTSGAEKALFWVESLRNVEFVGTESRLASIFTGLDEIMRFASDDADERIRALTEDAIRIQDEIDRIRATGSVEKYSPVKLNERFARMITTARELLSDFRTVEENFQKIAQEIAERHVQPGVTKGAIVGHMLDSHDALKQSSQGQSFYAFRELLLSPERQKRFDDAAEKAQHLPALSAELRANPILTQLIGRLLLEDETVLISSQRVSANLRRVLETTDLAERRKIAETIREIKTLALKVKDQLDYDLGFSELDDVPDPYIGMTRGLWREPARVTPLGPVEITEDNAEWDEFRRLRALPQIRLADLRRNVETCLEQEDTVILGTVLDMFPPRHGMIEVIGYLIIAASNDRHYIADTDNSEIQLPSGAKWRVPAVLFGRGR